MGYVYRMMSLTCVASILLCCTCIAQSHVAWIGTYNWAAVSPLGADVTFNCVLQNNGTDVLPANHTVAYSSERWQLPGGGKLQGPYYSIENKTINGDNLTIHNVALTDKGIYLCHVRLECGNLVGNQSCEKTEMWYKHGLNLNGPIYSNLLEKYQTNIITAAAAGGGILAVFALLCLVYKFRNKEPKESEDVTKLSHYTGTAVATSATDDAENTSL